MVLCPEGWVDGLFIVLRWRFRCAIICAPHLHHTFEVTLLLHGVGYGAGTDFGPKVLPRSSGSRGSLAPLPHLALVILPLPQPKVLYGLAFVFVVFRFVTRQLSLSILIL